MLSVAHCPTFFDALINATDRHALTAANASMQTLMYDLDRLLASSSGFLLGQWLRDARDLAGNMSVPGVDFSGTASQSHVRGYASDGRHRSLTDDLDDVVNAKDFLEWNARSQVTSWYPVAGKLHHDAVL